MSIDVARPGRAGGWVLPLNLLFFALAAVVAFRRNLTDLFYHFDGHYLLIEALNRVPPIQPLASFSNDFLQSIGNLQFPQNPLLQFYFLPLYLVSDPTTGAVAVYLMIALAAFLCAWVTARLLGQDRVVAGLAGWIVGVVCTPFVPIPFFYPILSVAPFMILLVVGPVIGFALLRLAGRHGIAVDALAVLGLVAVALFYAVASVGMVPLLAPAAIPYIAIAMWMAGSRAERWRKLAVLVAAAAALVALRLPWYLLGLFRFTAVGVFPGDFIQVYNNPVYASIVFHGAAFGWSGPAFAVAAQLGALASLRRGAGALRPAAIVVIAVFVLLLAFAGILKTTKGWVLPPPIYLEIAVWPLYALFAAVAVVRVAKAVARRATSPAAFVAASRAVPAMLPPVLSVVALGLAFSQQTTVGLTFPPKRPPVIERLIADATLRPNQPFRGRVATVIPVKEGGGEPWGQQFGVAYEAWQKSGNDHMTIGLWYFGIPTLFEYNQFNSPAFHALVKRTLQQPVLPHQRNVVIVSRVNEPVMSLLGVRYLVTPRGARALLDVRQSGGSLRELVTTDDWSLHEFAAPNLGTYSPTVVEVKRDLGGALDFLADPASDLAGKAIMTEPLDGLLVPATSTRLLEADGGLRLEARSEGRSLVVLPLEYSRCLALRPSGPGGDTGRLVRVDGLLTGVVFDREFDGIVEFRLGPLANPMCRWQDYRELMEMMGR